MEASINSFDAGYMQQFKNLPEKYVKGMLNGIVMFEIAVTRLDGKYKISQGKSDADKNSVMESLLESKDSTIHRLGEIMREEYS
ncbi:hypothetical protein [Pontibacter aydingkolensis]